MSVKHAQSFPIPLCIRGINIVIYLKGQLGGLSEIVYVMHLDEYLACSKPKINLVIKLSYILNPEVLGDGLGRKVPAKRSWSP